MPYIEKALREAYRTHHVIESGISMRKAKKHFPTTHYIINDSNRTRITVIAWVERDTTWYKVITISNL